MVKSYFQASKIFFLNTHFICQTFIAFYIWIKQTDLNGCHTDGVSIIPTVALLSINLKWIRFSLWLNSVVFYTYVLDFLELLNLIKMYQKNRKSCFHLN